MQSVNKEGGHGIARSFDRLCTGPSTRRGKQDYNSLNRHGIRAPGEGAMLMSSLGPVLVRNDNLAISVARQLMGSTGLAPSERSSGDKQRRGPIAGSGNRFLRRVLIESARHYSKQGCSTLVLARRAFGRTQPSSAPRPRLSIACVAAISIWQGPSTLTWRSPRWIENSLVSSGPCCGWSIATRPKTSESKPHIVQSDCAMLADTHGDNRPYGAA